MQQAFIPASSPIRLLFPRPCQFCCSRHTHPLINPVHSRSVTKFPILSSKPSSSDSSDPPDSSDSTEPTPPEHDIPKSTVDWNSEWAKFSESGRRSMAPKGREPVSKQRAAAARARNRVRSVTNRLPTRHQLFKDWRFWLAIIAALSLFSAYVQSSSQGGVGVI